MMASFLRLRVGRVLMCTVVGGSAVLLPSSTLRAAKPANAPANDSAAALRRIVEVELQRGPAPDLVPFLTNSDAGVRARTCVALGRLQDWNVAQDMVPLLGDPDPAVRRAAAFGLSELDPVMPLLVTQIKAGRKGSDPAVKGPALMRAEAEKKLDARLHLEDRADVRRALYAALGPTAIGAGLHHLQFGLEVPGEEAGWAARALGVHGHRRKADAVQNKEIFDLLRKLLANDSDDIRFYATYALYRLHSKDQAALVERLQADSDARVRSTAARALATLSGAEDHLVAALKDQDWHVQVQAVRSLAQAARPRGPHSSKDVEALGAAGVAALKQLASTTDLAHATHAHVALAVADALVHAAPPLALPQLEAMDAVLAGKTLRPVAQTWALRCAIQGTQDALTGGPVRVLTCGPEGEPAWRPQARAVEVIAAMPGGDTEKRRRLASYLRHAEPNVRSRAAGKMAELDLVKVPDVPDLLAEQLEREDDPAAAAAMADGIAKAPAAAHVKILAAALKRFSARGPAADDATASLVDALLAAQATADSPQLRPLLTSASARVRNKAFLALTALGEKVAPPAGKDPPLWPAKDIPARVTIKTARGDIQVRLYREDAPLTVTNFTTLARKGFYKGLTWHRVVGDFVVQGGDPKGDGSGGPGYAIPCEYNARPYDRGVLGMALSGKDSGGSQFFITQSPQPHLDGMYTAFGEVEDGMDVVDALLPEDSILDVVVQP